MLTGVLGPTAKDLPSVECQMITGTFLPSPDTITGGNIAADRDQAIHSIFIDPNCVSIRVKGW
jgi:hypothetical protein